MVVKVSSDREYFNVNYNILFILSQLYPQIDIHSPQQKNKYKFKAF